MSSTRPIVYVVPSSLRQLRQFEAACSKAFSDLNVVALYDLEKQSPGIKTTTIYVLPGAKISDQTAALARIKKYKVFTFTIPQYARFLNSADDA